MIYEKATAEVILFDNSDVITASPVCNTYDSSNPHICWDNSTAGVGPYSVESARANRRNRS